MPQRRKGLLIALDYIGDMDECEQEARRVREDSSSDSMGKMDEVEPLRIRIREDSPSDSTDELVEVEPLRIRLRGDFPKRGLASNAPLNIHFTRHRHNWDTIIVCHLLKDLFGRPISSEEVTQVIKARDGLEGTLSEYGACNPEDCLWSEDVESMLMYAQDPAVQHLYPITCQYCKWERVASRLWERKGKSDGTMDVRDREELNAFVIYNETLTTANLLVKPFSLSLLGRARAAMGATESPADRRASFCVSDSD